MCQWFLKNSGVLQKIIQGYSTISVKNSSMHSKNIFMCISIFWNFPQNLLWFLTGINSNFALAISLWNFTKDHFRKFVASEISPWISSKILSYSFGTPSKFYRGFLLKILQIFLSRFLHGIFKKFDQIFLKRDFSDNTYRDFSSKSFLP